MKSKLLCFLLVSLFSLFLLVPTSEAVVGAGGMDIFVKPLSGQTITISCDPSDTVEAVKVGIKDKKGFPVEKQRLLFAGKELENGKTMADYNITNKSSLFLIIKP